MFCEYVLNLISSIEFVMADMCLAAFDQVLLDMNLDNNRASTDMF